MLVFIDESGCPGFKITKGSDPIFAIGMVVFDTSADADFTASLMRDLHKSIPHKPEFKFSKTSHNVRDQFFQAVAACPFRVFAMVVRKEEIYSPTLRTDHDKFYNYFLKLLLGGSIDLSEAKIRLDGSGGRDFERALKSYLRREIEIRDFAMVDSKRDQLAQLADMCVGAIARGYRDRKNPMRWHKMLTRRIINVWRFR